MKFYIHLEGKALVQEWRGGVVKEMSEES